MTNCLKIVVVDTDPDYLYIEIFASSDRFSGATSVFSGDEQFKEFAEVIAGFPTSLTDQRSYVFGTKEKGFAGGYCALRFFCRDRAGHAAVDVELEDDDVSYSEASVRFTIPVLPSSIDEFVRRLRQVQEARSGEASLESTGEQIFGRTATQVIKL